MVAVFVVTLITAGVFVAAYETCSFRGCPSVAGISGFIPDQASVVLDRNGKEVAHLFKVNRVVVALDSLPDYVPEAFVATEDQDFYHHGGVDWSRVLGALWQNIRAGGIEEGFSTITMQVARNVFPERLPVRQRTLNRKISEIRVAREIESRFTKDEILELYLNQIYFGSGAWGIEAASQEYFGHPATELTLGEAALLAGLPQAPSRLSPREDMKAALERRKTVLRRMVSSGYITREKASEVEDTVPELARGSMDSENPAPYFVEHVRRLLEDRLGDGLYTEGYQIHTTLDLDAQSVTRRELTDQLDAIEKGRYGYYNHPAFNADEAEGAQPDTAASAPYLQGAAVVMAAHSGDVLAMVGGRDFEASKFNRATQAMRQPGSAFKPFVYAAAIQAGYPPTTILEDTPYRLVQNGRVWEPKNYDGSYSGEVTMREALVHSKNVATIRLAQEVGLDRVIDMARNLGISGTIPHYPSIAIGAADVNLVEMVAAYSTFATLGDRPTPRYITSVTDRTGRIVLQVPPRTRHVLASDVAFVTMDLMRGVVDRGTGYAVRQVGFTRPAAGKTGTTNESADAWFIGFTPDVTTGIWIGMDRPQRIMHGATGGRLAAPVWGGIMRAVDSRGEDWTPPPGVERFLVDPQGDIYSENCPVTASVQQEYFLRGTVRPRDCSGYGYPYGYDSLYYDSTYQRESESSWWDRLRRRVLGGDEEPEQPTRPPRQQRPDTIILRQPRQPHRDTVRLRRDTIRLEPDTGLVRHDTASPGQDTVPHEGPGRPGSRPVEPRPDTSGTPPGPAAADSPSGEHMLHPSASTTARPQDGRTGTGG